MCELIEEPSEWVPWGNTAFNYIKPTIVTISCDFIETDQEEWEVSSTPLFFATLEVTEDSYYCINQMADIVHFSNFLNDHTIDIHFTEYAEPTEVFINHLEFNRKIYYKCNWCFRTGIYEDDKELVISIS